MMVALGDAYEKLNRFQEAKKCFWRAHNVGDMEGMALFKLACVYERLGEDCQAKAAFTDYVHYCQKRGCDSTATDHKDQSHAYLFLARNSLSEGLLDEAYNFAHRCTEFAETREEAKGLLKQVADERALAEHDGNTTSMQVEDNSAIGGNSTLGCGDCLSGLTTLEEGSVAVFLTPPNN